MPPDDERGLGPGSRSTDQPSRGLPAQLADQAARRHATYPLIDPAAREEARRTARGLDDSLAALPRRGQPEKDGDGFRIVARENPFASEPYPGPSMTGKQASGFL